MEETWKAAIAGDKAAIDALLAKVEKIVHRYAWSFAQATGMDQDDLAQEGMIAVWKSLPQFDPTISQWNTYAGTVARRRMLRVVKDELRKRLPQDADMDSLALDDLVGPEDQKAALPYSPLQLEQAAAQPGADILRALLAAVGER